MWGFEIYNSGSKLSQNKLCFHFSYRNFIITVYTKQPQYEWKNIFIFRLSIATESLLISEGIICICVIRKTTLVVNLSARKIIKCLNANRVKNIRFCFQFALI